MTWLRLLPGRVWLWAVAIAGGFALLSTVIVGIRRDEREQIERRQLEAKDATNRRLKNADTSSGDAGADLDWLRARNKRTGRP